MKQSELMGEVREFIEAELDARRSVRINAATEAIVARHPQPRHREQAFYALVAYEHVRDCVVSVYRRYAPPEDEDPDAQLVMPGFERLQRAYPVERDGDRVLVPVELLTDAELDSKAATYEEMALGCQLHAKELRRYKSERRR
jgi:hypothetical protein